MRIAITENNRNVLYSVDKVYSVKNTDSISMYFLLSTGRTIEIEIEGSKTYNDIFQSLLTKGFVYLGIYKARVIE